MPESKKQRKKKKTRRNSNSTYCVVGEGKTPLGNYGVFCAKTGFLVDSAAKRSDAHKLCSYINARLETHPINSPTEGKWAIWCDKYQSWTPDANIGMAHGLNNAFGGNYELLKYSELSEQNKS